RPPAGPGRGGSTRAARPSAGGPRHRRRRAGAGPVLLVLAVVVALTTGWPLLSAAVSVTTPLDEGTGLRLEAPRGADARLTVHGTGWELHRPAVLPGAGWSLSRGDVRFEARPVVPVEDTPRAPAELPAALWNGLDRLVRIADPDARLGEPTDTETLGGLPALTGPLEREGCTGAAWVIPAPDAVNAVQITATDCGTGDGDAPADLPPEVERTALSTGFPGLRTDGRPPLPLAPPPYAAPRAPPAGAPGDGGPVRADRPAPPAPAGAA
ncbi:hypothetical protein, partial [Streptomyces calidiresistens]|uniref:hypothetical protein n=1 Tax=Streptomyces calidiresistens TaxID=1485586 RepID=UPI0015FAD5EA